MAFLTKNQKNRSFLVAAWVLTLAHGAPAFAEDDRYTLSFQPQSLAPNAGGQKAYALRFAWPKWEASAFYNEYLLSAGKPLVGGYVEYRFPVCGSECFWQFYVQTGGGLTTGGPSGQVTWSTHIPLLPIWLPTSAPRYMPALRVDIATQMIALRQRAVTWSYPLWAGVSVSF